MIDESETSLGEDADVQAWKRIAEWIRTACTAEGKSQKGLAKAMGIDETGVSRLAHGRRKLGALELAAVIGYLGEPPEEIRKLLTKLTQNGKTRGPKPALQDQEVGDTDSMIKQILYELSGLPSELMPSVLDNIRALKSAYDLGESRHPHKAGKGQ